MTVQHLDGDLFAIDIRGHRVLVDQPIEDGGLDTAPTPLELFIAGLTSCVAHYGRRYLARHELSAEGLEVTAEYEVGGRPARVTDIAIHITPPASLPEERKAAFLAVASHCTVHNTLVEAPKVNITVG
jgi:uncharacterized OsmC-like protein